MALYDNNYVIFKINDLSCALSCLEVQEIIRDKKHITFTPMADQHLSGVINIRGKIVTVVNFAKNFNLDSTESEADSIIIVNNKEEYIGLYVSEVIDVIDVSNIDIEHTPAVPHQLDPHFIKGVMEFETEITAVLNLKEILNVETVEAVEAE